MAESFYQEVSVATGLPGTSGQSRLVGTVSGTYPSTGIFSIGDYVTDNANGGMWVCVVGGSPGTWVRTGSLFTGATMSGTINTSEQAVMNIMGAWL